MTGVSPAFYISSFSNRFTLDEMTGSFKTINSLGYDSVQLEIFYHENLKDWVKGGSAYVKNELSLQNLASPVFIAHFLGDCVCDAERLMSDYGLHEWETVCEFLEKEALCTHICLPVFPYADDFKEREKEAFIDKVGQMLAVAQKKNLVMSLEVIPGSLGENKEVFSACPGLNMLFDSGHSHVMGWDIYTLPSEMAGRIVVTHLCENDGFTNLSLRPDILFDWPRIMKGFSGTSDVISWDVEIICVPEKVEDEYGKANRYIRDLMDVCRCM